jgi:predicted N-acetyltransferase YhbS
MPLSARDHADERKLLSTAGHVGPPGYRRAVNDDKTVATYRRATAQDAPAMAAVERAAHALLAAHEVRLDALSLPPEFEEPTGWTLAFVAELNDRVVGTARLTELTPDLLVLDQVSVDPEFGGQGIGRGLLLVVAQGARDLGYSAITGTTFRDLIFNGPFYATLGCVEDCDPHPTMVQRRKFEASVGLDEFGPRVVMRASL